MTRSQAFHRPPRFARVKATRLATVPSVSGKLSDGAEEEAAEEEDDDAPAFLTFSSLGGESKNVPQARQQREHVERSSRGYGVGKNQPVPSGRGRVAGAVPPVARSGIGGSSSLRRAEKNQREDSTSMDSSYSDIIDDESTSA